MLKPMKNISMNKMYPCLWFNNQANEAAKFYCSVFENSSIKSENPMVVIFELHGQKFMGLNGGSNFIANPSMSFFVVCETENETDNVWKKLSEEGTVLMPLDKYPWSEKYGWVQDKFGFSWQISLGALSDVGQKFTPSFLFSEGQYGKGEAAVYFYTSVFEPSSIVGLLLYAAGEEQPEGKLKHAQFTLNGQVFMSMDGPAEFTFNEAVSLVIECENQQEIDYYWNTLTSDGGQESMCGWLKDRFGVSWQVVPTVLKELMSDPERAPRVVQAFLKMKKFDIETLMQA